MTEYDYSPDAWERYQAKLEGVGRWANEANACRAQYGNPFLPSPSDYHASPAVNPREIHHPRPRHASTRPPSYSRGSVLTTSTSTTVRPTPTRSATAPLRDDRIHHNRHATENSSRGHDRPREIRSKSPPAMQTRTRSRSVDQRPLVVPVTVPIVHHDRDRASSRSRTSSRQSSQGPSSTSHGTHGYDRGRERDRPAQTPQVYYHQTSSRAPNSRSYTTPAPMPAQGKYVNGVYVIKPPPGHYTIIPPKGAQIEVTVCMISLIDNLLPHSVTDVASSYHVQSPPMMSPKKQLPLLKRLLTSFGSSHSKGPQSPTKPSVLKRSSGRRKSF
jgi:hypothetical protein